jgi:hypothetical protein
MSIINPKVRKYIVATLHEKLNINIMMMQALHLCSDIICIIIALGSSTYKYAKVHDDKSEGTIVNCFPLHFPSLVPLWVTRHISEYDFHATKRINIMIDSPVHHVGVGHGDIGEGRQLHEDVKDVARVEPVGVPKVHGEHDQGEP